MSIQTGAEGASEKWYPLFVGARLRQSKVTPPPGWVGVRVYLRKNMDVPRNFRKSRGMVGDKTKISFLFRFPLLNIIEFNHEVSC